MKTLFSIMAMIIASSFFSQQITQKAIGSDKDNYGCKESAGYVFSKIKNNCIKLFEEKIQLKERDSHKSYTSNATIIFSKDNKKAELFLPSLKESIILNLNPSKNKKILVYKNGKYTLTKQNNVYILKELNKIIFN
ncbi:hypothetical protein [Elizabethkingia anophelis]|uniref:Uncharacterized protein n=1 Tax=Elizabethkingia anophelis TaxID=1117645 RepID=A0AAU8VB06_9FLAO|nr:hypothetical protein [Elizabethkingia anophelis]AQX01458.1 hypothetical protein BBD32_08280 [Elizabethkingia anophelis]OPB63923.1 hypothetical protein BAY11_16760 [Elizabethkingia anophelis]